jgi:AcrR family transcriptional regulator
LRAIARVMGMTAPALYRYFDNREDLIKHVVADIFTEIAGGIHAAVEAAGQASGGDMVAKLVAACGEFRSWPLGHKEEFGLLFGTPLPGLEAVHDDVIDDCAAKFNGEFFALFLELWRKHPFPVPADDQIDPGLREQLANYRGLLGVDLPLGAGLTFLRCWVRLYGMVSLEVFGAHALRPGRRGSHVRDHARRARRAGRPAIPASLRRPAADPGSARPRRACAGFPKIRPENWPQPSRAPLSRAWPEYPGPVCAKCRVPLGGRLPGGFVIMT